jgi:hypothetical protein
MIDAAEYLLLPFTRQPLQEVNEYLRIARRRKISSTFGPRWLRLKSRSGSGASTHAF